MVKRKPRRYPQILLYIAKTVVETGGGEGERTM